ncbi:MAG: HsdR family type I site-specific deoxyribonuclease [Thermoguttaceae bacterium]|nr:HsdR family type I site-specific deoxyribonuclease [Thermoguttaceae bacterium]
MFDEPDFEPPFVEALACNGWRYFPAGALPRDYGDVLVEPMVKAALIRLNPCIAEDPSRADEVLYKLRALIMTANANNLVTQNELFKKLVFEQNSFPFGENGKMVSVKFFGTLGEEELAKNEYAVTNQWIYPKIKDGKRFDVVLLVNGFPMVVGELKTPTRNAISWIDGAEDVLAYEKTVPQMFVTNVFNFATEGKIFRYGALGAPIDKWGPWHTGEDKSEGTFADVKRSALSMLTPSHVVDIFRFFTLFSTDKHHQKYKVVCRYQQYEGANGIVERVRRGRPKQGLIWHFQGSGKSLLMLFAAQKLRMLPDLKQPTVVVVVDRLDLDAQITATFTTAETPNLALAESKKELTDFFKHDSRKILITTIFKFGEVDGVLNERSNIVLLVDEAHRTQEGDLGKKMRAALPNAFFFGLTGTPINKIDRNTFRTFGAAEDPSGYMSLYSFSDSIRDGATLPLQFETTPVVMHINQDAIDEEFELLAQENRLTDEEKSKVARHVKFEALMKADDRVEKVCRHIVSHYQRKVEPDGFKGMVVCYNREFCVLYKEALDRAFGSSEHTDIVMDTNADKEDKFKEWRRSRDEESKLLDRFRNPNDPLKLLVVTSKLLTGFDAPILQTMYLDKPMRDHTLLQAICRVNRVYGDVKRLGLIVDYIGVFDDVANALRFDDREIQDVVTNIDRFKDEFPKLMENCLAFFPGVDRKEQGWDGLLKAQDCLPNNEKRDEFAAHYRALNKAYNAISPDTFLVPYEYDYKWLTKVYNSVRPADSSGRLLWAAVGAKTMELVNRNVTVDDVVDADPDGVIEMGVKIVEEYINKGEDVPSEDVAKAARKLEINLLAKIKAHSDDPKYVKLGERLEELREKHEMGLIKSLEFLKYLLDIAKQAVRAEKEVVPVEERDPGKAALTELFMSVKNANTPVIVERIVNDIDDVVRKVRFNGWQNTSAGVRTIKCELRDLVFVKYNIRDAEVLNKAYAYVEEYY